MVLRTMDLADLHAARPGVTLGLTQSFCSLFAVAPVQDLLLYTKHLFVHRHGGDRPAGGLEMTSGSAA